tara:strand:+ start:2108 stop:2356 length:249 start_codon:yes stop_codon:yes gene_type:complete
VSGWQPRPIDIKWSESLIRTIKQGGIWSTTNGRSIYKFDHDNKKLITVKNEDGTLHDRICIVFAELGWTVDTPVHMSNPERN